MVLLVLLHHPFLLIAGPLGLTGIWRYSESGGDTEDRWSFNQSYDVNFGKELSAGINFTGDLRYSDTKDSEENDRSLISPSAAIDFRSDWFAFNLSGTGVRRETSDQPEFTEKAWNASWFSLLEKWPQLRLNYGQSYQYDDQNPHSQNDQSTYFSASMDYTWSVLRFFYDFRTDLNKDRVTDTATDTDRHFANIQLTKDFLNHKLNFSASQQYSFYETEVEGDGGEFYLSNQISDPNNTSLLPVSGLLKLQPPVEIGKNLDAQEIIIHVFQPVDRIRAYLNRDVSDKISVENFFIWEVYRSKNGITWEPIEKLPFIESEVKDEISVVNIVMRSKLEEGFLKIRVRPSSIITTLRDVSIESLEAQRRIEAETDISKFNSQQSRLSFNYRPLTNWSLAYNLTHTRNKPDPGLDNTQLNHSLNSSYILNRYFSTSIGVNEYRDKTEDQEKQISRVYSVSMSSSPLTTLDLSAGYTRSDCYDGGTHMTSTDSLNGYLSALIFPDLSAGLTGNWSKSWNYITENDSTVFGWRIYSTARIDPKVNLDVYYESVSNEGDSNLYGISSASSDSNRYGIGLSYRPSDIFLVYSNLDRDEEDNNTTFSGNISWKWTPKILISGRFALDISQGDTESYDASLNWSISRHLSLRSSFDYQSADDLDSWNLLNTLNVNF